jgi:SAM-dependent methyltransferase
MKENIDKKTVDGFGDEWERFAQDLLKPDELNERFNEYFSIFPWDELPANSIGFDMGCGSGRWADLVAEKVGTLNCVDPSERALNVARKNLSKRKNCNFFLDSVDALKFENNSQDFGYSLGVLHHIPDTKSALKSCVDKLKPGAPFLLYLYYAFDNRPLWYRLLWRMAEILRYLISRLPYGLRYFLSQIIAFFIYFPLTRVSILIERMGFNVSNFPLSYYRNYSFYTMRTDALDRFGTRLEKRFSKASIEEMMKSCGLTNIKFSSRAPYWVSLGYKDIAISEGVE